MENLLVKHVKLAHVGPIHSGICGPMHASYFLTLTDDYW